MGIFSVSFSHSKDKRNPENALKARARSQKERERERKKERDDGDDDDDEKYPSREDRSKRDAQTTLLDRVGNDGERLRNVIEDV